MEKQNIIIQVLLKFFRDIYMSRTIVEELVVLWWLDMTNCRGQMDNIDTISLI